MGLIQKITKLLNDTSLDKKNIPNNEEIIRLYNMRFEDKGIKDLLRRFGLIRYINHLFKQKISGTQKFGYFLFTLADFYAAFGRLITFKQLLKRKKKTFLNHLDKTSQYLVFQLLRASYIIQRYTPGEPVLLKHILPPHQLRIARNDYVAYHGQLHLDYFKNIVHYSNLQFYIYYPAPNVVLYDHGLLDPSGPKLPLEYDAIFDVGGYIGDSAVVLSQYLSKNGNIYSFEPSMYARYIKKNAKLNGFLDKVEIVHKRVGIDSDDIKLDVFAKKKKSSQRRNISTQGRYRRL